MNKMLVQGIAFILLLLSLPLASIGTTTETTFVSILALALIAVGGIVPPILRFVGNDEGEDSD